MTLPRLIGMVHLLPLPGSPRAKPMKTVIDRALSDAQALAKAGFDALMIENFGDAPFFPGRVPAETVAAMTAVIARVCDAVSLPIGVNVLRNDGLSALAIAAAVGASFIRVNVVTGAMVTDQGVIQGNAHELARLRSQLCPRVALFADVLVKHAQPLAPITDVGQLVHDTVARGLADALVVSGEGTGRPVALDRLQAVADAASAPVYIGSGLDLKNARALLSVAHGAIVGSSIKRGDSASAVDVKKATKLVQAASKS